MAIDPVNSVEISADIPAANSASDPVAAAAGTSFANKAKSLQSNRNSWIDIARKRKKITSVTGTGEASVLEGVERPKRDFWEIAVSRLKEGTTEDKVKTHLQGKGIEVREVFVFPSKIKGTVAAKVRVELAHKDRALDAGSWPPHLRISSWAYKPKAARKNEAPRDAAEKRHGL